MACLYFGIILLIILLYLCVEPTAQVWALGFEAVDRPNMDDTSDGIFIPELISHILKKGELIAWSVFFGKPDVDVYLQVSDCYVHFFYIVQCDYAWVPQKFKRGGGV